MDTFHKENLVTTPESQMDRLAAEKAARETLPEDVRMDYELLEHYLPMLFANEHKMERYIAQHGLKMISENDYTAEYLPYHTRDNAWLSKYFASLTAKYNEPIDFQHISKYVAESAMFDGYRSIYEQDLIRAEIKHQMKTVEQDHAGLTMELDDFFRHTILDHMSCFGLDQHTVETVLESNAGIWRRPAMIKTFEQQFYPQHDMVIFNTQKSPDEWKNLIAFKQVHQDAWLRYREYAYYQQHKDIIDELGLANENMTMKPRMVAKLLQRLEKYNQICADKLAVIQPTVNEPNVSQQTTATLSR